MSGAGKSVTACDLLTQTEGYFAYTVIIEEGLSYGIYTATVEPGARPIIIHPDGDLTINYLDTKGLPLTPDHLSAATALVARMIGTSAHETNRCSGRRKLPNTSTCYTKMRSKIGRRNVTTSFSTSRATHWPFNNSGRSECRPAQRAWKPCRLPRPPSAAWPSGAWNLCACGAGYIGQ